MVHEIIRGGLIIAHAARTTALVDEFSALCDWPIVLHPSPRALFQQIDASRPACLVFWLEAMRDISPTAELVARLRDRGPRPYRIVIAHRLDESVEHTFRSAGVHSYVASSGNLRALVDDTLLPLVDPRRAAIRGRMAAAGEVPVPIQSPTEARASPATMRPP